MSGDTVEKIAEKALSGEPRKATFSDLRSKPRRKLTFNVTIQDENGEDVTLTMVFQGINPKAYDDLIAEHPPTPSERSKGAIYNSKTFPSALISKVSCEPEMTYDEVEELRASPEWSSGEYMSLFYNAQTVCSSGLDVPFNARG